MDKVSPCESENKAPIATYSLGVRLLNTLQPRLLSSGGQGQEEHPIMKSPSTMRRYQPSFI